MTARALTSQALTITGPAGGLEALLEVPAPATPGGQPVGGALICHPHPQHGGTMHNKVVHTVARAFHEHGWATLRFNFRGVGASVGTYAEGVGETADAIAAAAWLVERFAGAPLALAGFSFGGAVAFNAAAVLNPALLITVAPAIDRVSVALSGRPTSPWLVVQGDADDVVAAARVQSWVAAFEPQPEPVVLPGVGHFFHGALSDLRTAVEQFVGKKRPGAVEAPGS